MKLMALRIDNFRSIESIDLSFPSYYTAISGKNNSGKSNLLRALKSLFDRESPFPFRAERTFSRSENLPNWLGKDCDTAIKFLITVSINRDRDSSVFKLAKEFFGTPESATELVLEISAEYGKDKDQSEIVIKSGGEALESYKSRTLLKTIKSSGAFQFHNSTETDPFDRGNNFVELLGEIGRADREKIAKDRDRLSKTVADVARRHQKELSDLLGRLEDKYNVGLTAPTLNVDYLPIEITLGDKNPSVSLEDWGSGTQNRTHVLMALFRAKRLSESLDEDTKIAPILVIEEPESFLHPSAQAEFGRVMQDLSEELQIQVLVATHSPYFLSHQDPASNVLLRRKFTSGRLTSTEKVEVNSSNWMEPFALNLGLSNPEFEPWKDLFFSRTSKILLVEGKSDKEYFEMLRHPDHGSKRLQFDGEIFAYDGKSNISNGLLLRFIKGRYNRFFVTYDLDADNEFQKLFDSLTMERNKHFCPVGIQEPGHNKIEGLLPEHVRSAVYGAEQSLVQQAIGGNAEQSRSAKSRLKGLLLDEFRRTASPGDEYYGQFYKVVKIINKAFN